MHWWTLPLLGWRAIARSLLGWRPRHAAPWPHGLVPVVIAALVLILSGLRGAPAPGSVLGLPAVAYGLVVALVMRRSPGAGLDAWLAALVGAVALGLGWTGLDIATGHAALQLGPLLVGRGAVALLVAVVLAHSKSLLSGVGQLIGLGFTVGITLWTWSLVETFSELGLTLGLAAVGITLPDWIDVVSELAFRSVFWLAFAGVTWIVVEAAVEESAEGRPVELRAILAALVQQTLKQAG